MADDALKIASETLLKAARELKEVPQTMLRAAAEQRSQARATMLAPPETPQTQASAASWQEQHKDDVEARRRESAEALRQEREERDREMQEMRARVRARVQARREAREAEAPGPAPAATPATHEIGGLRADVARMHADTSRQASPQGLAQLAAAQAPAPAATPAETAAAGQGPSAMEQFARAARAASGALGTFRAAVSATEGMFLGVAAKASPAAAATFQGSMDLLMARIGSNVLPALEVASRTVQQVAAAVPSGAVSKNTAVAAVLGPGAWLMEQMKDRGWVKDDGAMKRSLAGLPQAQMGTAEQFHDRAQMAALNTDDVQTEILRTQLQNLEAILGVLQNPQGPGDRVVVPFR
jgi:hypothetical protein